jgi:hypothetical protein
MKQEKYIYKEVEKFNNGNTPLEEALNKENTNLELHHIIEMDYKFIIIWKG